MKIDVFSIQSTVAQVVRQPDPEAVLAASTETQSFNILPLVIAGTAVLFVGAWLLIRRRRHHR